MSHKILTRILIFLSIVALILVGCGNSTNSNDPVIATAVALTVAAQNAQPSTETPTLIPTATIPPQITFPTPTAGFSVLPTKTPSGVNADVACAKADFVSETIPDGTIMKPGATFTKVWTLKNSSTCVWNSNYKIAYYNGDLMGGAYVYNLPEIVAPEDTVDIPLVLTAPADEGTYTGRWVLQTPNGIVYGVGQYSEAFYVKITVSKADKPVTAISGVKLDVIRDPQAGCATTVRYHYVARVEANGPIKIKYAFNQSDGNLAWRGDLEFKEAGSQTVTGEWSFHLGNTPGTKWVQFVIFKVGKEAVWQEFEKEYFSYLCGNTP